MDGHIHFLLQRLLATATTRSIYRACLSWQEEVTLYRLHLHLSEIQPQYKPDHLQRWSGRSQCIFRSFTHSDAYHFLKPGVNGVLRFYANSSCVTLFFSICGTASSDLASQSLKLFIPKLRQKSVFMMLYSSPKENKTNPTYFSEQRRC